ncbi:MAG: Pr6Pr family membrane protein [Rubricella sp.]
MRLEGIIAVIAWAALAWQFRLNWLETGDAAAAAWDMARYFTVLTNLLVAIVFTRAALTRRKPSAGLSAAVTIYIAVVGGVYHGLLARNLPVSDPEFWSDHGFHTLVPILVVIWWIAKAPKARLAWSRALAWIAYPLGYLVYAMARGMADGVYPYFFIDLPRQGFAMTALWVAALSGLFLCLGLVAIGAGRALR